MSMTIAAIGECMLELSKSSGVPASAFSRPVNLAFGGDSLNTCIYLARLGLKPSYVTVLGDDPLSLWMAECWRQEGIDCSRVRHAKANSPVSILLKPMRTGSVRSFIGVTEHP